MFISRADVSRDVAQKKKCTTTWRHIHTPCASRVYVLACACVCVCARVRVSACAHVHVHAWKERDKHPFQDNVISLLSRHLIYTLELIFKVMWDYVSCFKVHRRRGSTRSIDNMHL